MKRKCKMICALLLSVMLLSSVLPVYAATEQVVLPSHGVVSGKYLYYAFGCDGGGDLYKYNINTQKTTLLSKGLCSHISQKGNYLYFVTDLHEGSDGTNYKIFRISTSGKGKKQLADGCSPVIIGNYIYYIAAEHQSNGYEYDKLIGVYRMKLDGSKKTCIYKSDAIKRLAAGKNKLYMQLANSTSRWDCYDIKTKKITQSSIENSATNATYTYEGYSTFHGNVSGGGYTYTFYSNTVYRNKGSKRVSLLTMDGMFRKMFYSNGYIIAVSETSTKANAYIINKNGKGKKLIASWVLAGGGWNY